mgnify:CR=1 FL=1
MGKFINPFTDFGFHRIFGQEVHKELLIDFLNQLFFGEHDIEDITFLNPIQTPETLDDRGIVFDVHCKDSNGNLFVVEMQTGAQPYFHDRGLYYLARAISNQGQKGKDWKFALQPVYGVFLLNYKMDVNSKFRTDVILADRETGSMFSDRIRQVYLELPYFQKEPDECENDFERWIYVLKHMDTLDRMPFKARKAIFERLERIGSMANLTPKQRAQYEAEWKMYNDYYNTLDFAVEKGMKKGMEKGMEKGLQEGLQKGLQKGKAEGKAEGRQEEKHSIALNLKKLGVSIEQIAFATGLSIEEIEKL